MRRITFDATTTLHPTRLAAVLLAGMPLTPVAGVAAAEGRPLLGIAETLEFSQITGSIIPGCV